MTISNENDFLRSLQFSDYDFNDVLNTSIPIKKKEDIPTTDLRSPLQSSIGSFGSIDFGSSAGDGSLGSLSFSPSRITNSVTYRYTTDTLNPNLELNGTPVTSPSALMRLPRNSDSALANAASRTLDYYYGDNIMAP